METENATMEADAQLVGINDRMTEWSWIGRVLINKNVIWLCNKDHDPHPSREAAIRCAMREVERLSSST
jgi:hypothetical protein